MQRSSEDAIEPPVRGPAAAAVAALPERLRWRLRGAGVLAAAVGALLAADAVSAPPPDADPALHAWFDRQRNVRGILCCSIADGHILSDEEWRTNGASYEVFILGQWRQIQASQLRDPAGGPNPTGRAIVWYMVRDRVVIYCFAPGTEL